MSTFQKLPTSSQNHVLSDACQRRNATDWGRIALFLFFPLFVLGFVADKFNVQIGAVRYIKLTLFALLAAGTICVIMSWRSSQPQDPQARVLATLFFVVFDLWLLWLLWLAWRYGASII
jgi:hypothetical protein